MHCPLLLLPLCISVALLLPGPGSKQSERKGLTDTNLQYRTTHTKSDRDNLPQSPLSAEFGQLDARVPF